MNALLPDRIPGHTILLSRYCLAQRLNGINVEGDAIKYNPEMRVKEIPPDIAEGFFTRTAVKTSTNRRTGHTAWAILVPTELVPKCRRIVQFDHRAEWHDIATPVEIAELRRHDLLPKAHTTAHSDWRAFAPALAAVLIAFAAMALVAPPAL